MSAGLLYGCAESTTSDTYCSVDEILYFKDDATVAWLKENDPELLRGIVLNNERYQRICAM